MRTTPEPKISARGPVVGRVRGYLPVRVNLLARHVSCKRMKRFAR